MPRSQLSCARRPAQWVMSARQVWASNRCKSIERCEATASRQLASRPPQGSWKVAKSSFLQKSARERCGTTGTDGPAARKSSGLLLDFCLHVQYMRTEQSLLAVSSPEVGFFSDGRGGNGVEAATAACQSPHWRVLRKATAASWTRDQCVERPTSCQTRCRLAGIELTPPCRMNRPARPSQLAR